VSYNEAEPVVARSTRHGGRRLATSTGNSSSKPRLPSNRPATGGFAGPEAFRTLAQLAALRTGQVLTIGELAGDAKLNAVTAGRYLNRLETSFLIRRLPPS